MCKLGETAGSISSRLTLPKLHLATLIVIIIIIIIIQSHKNDQMRITLAIKAFKKPIYNMKKNSYLSTMLQKI